MEVNKKTKVMENTINIDYLLSQIMQLDKSTRENLMNRINRLLKGNDDNKSKVEISDLEGLGAELWNNIDIENYIKNERQWD